MTAAPTHLRKWNAQLAYRSVVEATADKAGLDYLRQLVKNLAKALGVRHAFVAEFAGAEDRVRTLAGMNVPAAKSRTILRALGCDVNQDGDAAKRFLVQPPSWRADLQGPADLVEDLPHPVGRVLLDARVHRDRKSVV